MEKMMEFDDATKRKIGLISFLPAFSFFVCLVYYLLLLSPLTHANYEPNSAQAITSAYYNTMFIMLAISGVIGAAVLIYTIVLLARVKNMNAPTKIIWLLLLAAFVPVSIIAFWVFVIKREPRYVPIYPDIA